MTDEDLLRGRARRAAVGRRGPRARPRPRRRGGDGARRQPHAVARATLPTAPGQRRLELHFPARRRARPAPHGPRRHPARPLHPARAGADGVAVTGEPLPAAAPLAPTLRGGRGRRGGRWWGRASPCPLADRRTRPVRGRRPRARRCGRPRAPCCRHSPAALRIFGSLEVADPACPRACACSVSGDLRVAATSSAPSSRAAATSASPARAWAPRSTPARSRAPTARCWPPSATPTPTWSRPLHDGRPAGRHGRRRGPSPDRARGAARRAHQPVPGLAARLSEAVRALHAPGVAVEERVERRRHHRRRGDRALRRGTSAVTVEAVRAAAQASRARAPADAEHRGPHLRRRGGLHAGLPRRDPRQPDPDRRTAPTTSTPTSAGTCAPHGAGATVRGGTLRVGGRLLTTELGAPGGAPVQVVLEGAGGPRAAARADVAHPGVEVLLRRPRDRRSRRRRSTFRSDLTKRTGWCAPRIPSAEPRGRTPDGCG